MKRVHSLHFEGLESRQLLSTAHGAAAHTPHAAGLALVLNGTLNVNDNPDAMSETTNVDDSTTTSVPVSGNLGTVGKVKGVWEETVDEFGDYDGPDMLILHNAKGTFGVAFNDQNAKPVQAKSHGAITYEHAQQVLGGNGAYARATETGSIDITTNAARTRDVSMTLSTQSS